MENNHLAYLKIKNFKKFESLEVKDIGLINLIVGDNNVGKTCLLEALLFDEDNLIWLSHLHSTVDLRGIIFRPKITPNVGYVLPKQSFFEFIARDENKPIQVIYKRLDDIETHRLAVEYKNIAELNAEDFSYRNDTHTKFKDLVHWLKFFKNGVFNEIIFMYRENIEKEIKWKNYYPFISFNLSYRKDVKDFIKSLDVNRKDSNELLSEISYNYKIELIHILNQIFNFNIVDYETRIFGDTSIVSIAENDGKYIPITVYGDGFGKIFRYVVEIMYLKEIGGERIMIDEIDTGIHYTKLKEFWVAIIFVCRKMGVQLFATTHSKGCMEALIEASKENNTEDVRLIKLLENKDKTIKAITYPFNEFQYLIESETETR